MTPEQTDLARRLPKLWAPGMVLKWTAIDGHPVSVRLDGTCTRGCCIVRDGAFRPKPPDALADLDDDATAGCLLTRLWALDPDSGWHVHGPGGTRRFVVHDANGEREHSGSTLGEAVARALLAVPR